MNHLVQPAPGSPLLDHCPASLPAAMYYDAAQFEREQRRIWARNWIYVGRTNELEPMTVKRAQVAGQNLILVKDASGEVNCFYNTCSHRGAELCSAEDTLLKSKLIACPYHAWSFDLKGNLVTVPHASLTSDFKKEEHGLLKVHTHEWNGFLYVCLADNPPDFNRAPDLGHTILDNWPMAELATGHTLTKMVECNWKIFWENYNECLHCPGIHPELSAMVPIYSKGYMAANEDPDWRPKMEAGTQMRPGARTWTVNGMPCGPEFPGLSAEERARGQLFITLYPTQYIVAHVDYIRVVSMRPMAPERTEFRAQWLFAKETLAQPGFDLENVTKFVITVMNEDAAACEMNQRGLKNAAFRHGRLMPQEFDVHRFQNWVLAQLA
jgi:glycine betaine catabolism A